MVSLRFTRQNVTFLIIGAILIVLDFAILSNTRLFVPFLAISAGIGWLPFWTDILAENRRQKEIESRFPDFVRNLTGAIKSGMPAAEAVIQVADTDYAALSPYVKKFSNQLEWAIPFHRAVLSFGNETKNPIIKRALATMVQAEQAGGNIEDVLVSITESLVQIKKIKEERKAGIHAQVIQSYIIFFVFLGIMVLIQNLLVPYMVNFSQQEDSFGISTLGEGSLRLEAKLDFSSPVVFVSSLIIWFSSLPGIFLLMGVIQGFFAGVVLGKLAEGDLTSGFKHSIIMMSAAFIIISFAQGV